MGSALEDVEAAGCGDEGRCAVCWEEFEPPPPPPPRERRVARLVRCAARVSQGAEARAFGAEERSLHNIADLVDAAEHSLSILKRGRLP
ncbi:uncharacterized protein A4U43_C10F1920 [Asparagus officinalis]|uniref:LYR motif containing domain-containing protein n=1 Tax=Asparagus officinalis TaxID=4686 RepID=A0A5P1DZW5_ASPOF|nr:uncharacterized protein A4U43_C10F1920 [Asparagus officinalis]